MELGSRLTTVALFMLVLMTGSVSATEWTVCASGCDFATIQDAVSAAGSGDLVSVKPGTYTGTGTSAVDIVSKGITLNSTNGSRVTIIDGQNVRTCLTLHPSSGFESTIEGFTFLNGRSSTAGDGGGLHINSASPAISNCVFQSNHAENGGGLHIEGPSSALIKSSNFQNNTASVNGGGAFNRSANEVTFIECDFSQNHAINGTGGGLCFGDVTIGVVTQCRFNLNDAALSGGGVFLGSNTVVDFSTCDFLSNESGDHGGGAYTNSQETSFDNCIYKSNTAANVGGGLYVYAGLLVTVTQCSFTTNHALSGGGIGNYTSSPTVTNCEFFGNQATSGGAIFNHKSLPEFHSCSITENQAHNGGAAYDLDSDPHFINCDVASNSANNGGAFYEYQSRAQFAECTVLSNTAVVAGGGLYISTGMWAPHISNSLFRDNTASTDGGAIESDSTDVVVIEHTRFCGNNTDHISVGTILSTDAFTFFLDECPECVGDATGDWVVDLDDFSMLLVEYGSSGDLPSDHDGDGDVDLADFSLLLIHYGEDCWDETLFRSSLGSNLKPTTKNHRSRRISQ